MRMCLQISGSRGIWSIDALRAGFNLLNFSPVDAVVPIRHFLFCILRAVIKRHCCGIAEFT